MADNLKQKVVRGALWAMLERLSTEIIGFLVTIILARLLTPSDYGIVALLTIFVTISGVFASSGFGSALIQKKDADDLDFNSVFYFSLFISLLLYAVLFFIAPLVARFYRTPELTSLMRVLTLTVIFNSINSVQNAVLSRNLLFHLSFRISLISTFTTLFVGVPLAYFGYGAWAIVWTNVIGCVVGVLARWYYIAWRPRLMFSFKSLRDLFQFGWKMFVSVLIDTIYNNLYGLLIGRLYTKADLAYVNKGRGLPQMAMDSINATLGRVAFPALAQVQDDANLVRQGLRKMVRDSTYLVFPMLAGVAACAKPLVLLMFGDQWLDAVPYVKVSCIMFAFWPFHTINLQGILAIGRSDIFLYLELVKKVLGVVLLVAAAKLGVFVFVCAMALASGPVAVLINSYPVQRLVRYTILMQFKDVALSAVVSVIMYFICQSIYAFDLPILSLLFYQVLLGLVFYVVTTVLLKCQAARDYFSVVMTVLGSKSPRLARPLRPIERFLNK